MDEEKDHKAVDYENEVKYGFGREGDRVEEGALFDKIEFTHRERQLIRYLIGQYLVDSIKYCNLGFEKGIDDYERVLLRATSILRKISNESGKFWKAIRDKESKFVLVEKPDEISEQALDDMAT